MRHVAYLCLLTVCAPLIRAQEVTRGNWNQVAAIPPGQQIEIHPFAGKRLRGRFRSATSDAVSIETNSAQMTVNRTDVRVLKVRRSSGRFRNAGIGAAVGGGIAGGISVAILHDDLDDELALPIILVVTLVGAAVGFAVGTIPAAYNTIYQARRP